MDSHSSGGPHERVGTDLVSGEQLGVFLETRFGRQVRESIGWLGVLGHRLDHNADPQGRQLTAPLLIRSP